MEAKLLKFKISRRIALAHMKVRRILRWQFNNSPYLSGDSFADSVDFTFFSNRYRLRSYLSYFRSGTRVIFTQGENLEATLERIRDTGISVVIAGNSDRDYDQQLPEVPTNVKKLFIQNLNFFHPKYDVLPIGLENLRLGKNGSPSLFRSKLSWESRQPRILIAPFNITHQERMSLLKFKKLEGPWDYFDIFINEKRYRALSLKYKFVACPRGNGIDTHRFWETLYSGAYPIVKESPWSENVSKLGIPFLSVSDWSELELKRVSKLEVPQFDPKSLQPLWINFWNQRFSETS